MSTVTTLLNLVKPAPLENFSRATYNNNLDLIDAYAVNTTEKLAKGRKIKSAVTAPSGAISTLSVVNNISTFTFKANREYEIVWDFNYYGSITNGFFEMSIASSLTTDGASLTTGLTYLNQRTHFIQEGGSAFVHHGFVKAAVRYGADTTVQLKFLAKITANSGTVVIMGDASAPALYTIDDMGAQI